MTFHDNFIDHLKTMISFRPALAQYRQNQTSLALRLHGPVYESQRATSGLRAMVWEPLVYAYKIYPIAITVLAVLCYQKYYIYSQALTHGYQLYFICNCIICIARASSALLVQCENELITLIWRNC